MALNDMGVRNLIKQVIDDFRGLNTLEPSDNLPPNIWTESSNVVVGAAGNPTALRSPYQISSTTLVTTDTGTNSVLSIFNNDEASTAQIYFDIATTSGPVNTYRFATQFALPATATVLTTGQAASKRFDSIEAGDAVYRANGAVYQQIRNISSVYPLGISAPFTLPTFTTSVGGGTTILTSGIYASYAYYNGNTADVGEASLPSLTSSGAMASGVFSVNVAATSQLGVTGIVLFLSKDGGALRYLVINSSTGLAMIYPNSTAAISFSSPWTLDTTTQETAYNSPPFFGATQVERWQDRLYWTGFYLASDGVNASPYRGAIIYSGKEAIPLGTPTAAYPPLNLIQLPAESPQSRVTVATPVGLVCLATNESYLLTGDPGDNITAPQQPLAVTASLTSLSWNLGTRWPNTAVVTPYGMIWLDQNKRIRLWNYSGFPEEIAIQIRPDLDNISSVDDPQRAEAAWLDKGQMQYYVLTARTTLTGSPWRLYIVGFYKSSKEASVVMTCAVSDIQCTAIAIAPRSAVIPRTRLCIGSVGMVQEIFDFNQQGNGWQPDQTLHFSIMAGNDIGDYTHLHSLRFDSSQIGTKVTVANQNGSDKEAVYLEHDDQSNTWKGVVNAYGVRKKLRFDFPGDDAVGYEVNNVRLNFSGKKRVL